MRLLFLSFLLPLLALAPASGRMPAKPDPLVLLARHADEQCRGTSGSEEATNLRCSFRDQVFETLEASGYCFGKKGQIGADMAWHRCGPTSIRAGD
ncbi:hypothetical protein QA633_02885 [Bradyrhizobium barranii]|uniref:hypothetical protein n=1 Tax=Bradyrhizobium barranii TaxID=2992140 RepID=UPI0024B18F1A|nr:hypothetical protein [Bradyrhizobium barranii]WFT96081.1 hypothetical protein QA633_02885 [Bradyrhizobium barranii]